MVQDVEATIIDILRNDFSVRRPVTAKSLICYDIGICDGEFQDFMLRVEERFGLNLPTPCHLPFREEEATVELISHWVLLQQ